MLPSRFFRSSRSRARQKIAITSEATVMSKPSSRGKPLATPPSERHDRAQRAVVHVEHAAPGDAARIDAERIAPIDVIVEQRGEQIVRRGDGVEVAGEVQVDVLHRHDLGIAAAGGAALHAEGRAERRLAQAQHRLLADVIERVGQADRGRGLALAGRRRRDRGDQDQLAVRLALQRLDVVHRHLGLVVAVGLEIFRADAEPFFATSRIGRFLAACEISMSDFGD